MNIQAREAKWTDDMGEISGFGGSYEAGCRAMVLAGVEWLQAHPDAELRLKGYAGIYGIVLAESPDTKDLEAAVMDARVMMDGGRVVRVREECTGAMHHATMSHLMFIASHAWHGYARVLRLRECAPAPPTDSKP